MSAPLTPAPLPELAYSRFRFVPSIAGAGHNEWTLRRATWTEMVVVNAQTGQELAIPRRFLGRVFETGCSVRDVRLLEDLECAGGRARPVRRGVIQMQPRLETDTPPWLRHQGPESASPVVAIRVESPRGSRVRRALRSSAALGFVACLAVVLTVPTDLGLTSSDDYTAVVDKLGTPANDDWSVTPGGGGYRRLSYPGRRIAVILAGESNDTALYVGALSRSGRIVHAAVPAVLDEIRTTPGWR